MTRFKNNKHLSFHRKRVIVDTVFDTDNEFINSESLILKIKESLIGFDKDNNINELTVSKEESDNIDNEMNVAQ